MIQLKRAYDPIQSGDGCRILIDRLWPRGISKEDLKIDYWFKEVAPSDELRSWFDHDPEKFAEFKNRYRSELSEKDEVNGLQSLCREKEKVTLIYAAKDQKHNNAVVLKEYLEEY